MVKLTNISGGLIVCDLKDKSTLRLDNRKTSEPIEDSAITKHIQNLVSKGLVLSETVKSTAPKKAAEKGKEEVNNGTV